MKNLKNIIAAAIYGVAMLSAVPASAAIITVGNLSSDTVTNVTTDTKTGRQYTRFDAFNLTYDETLTAIAPGGAWAGWSIVNSVVAEDFISAALGITASLCTGKNSGLTNCGTISGWNEGKFGANWNDGYDYFFFLDSSIVGYAEFGKDGKIKQEELVSNRPNIIDNYKDSNINYLLYKEKAFVDVPEPVSLALFGLGLAGLGLAKRRRRA